MKTNYEFEVEGFLRSILHRNTEFTIKTVYQYDTYPFWHLCEVEEEESGDYNAIPFGWVMHYLATTINQELRKVGLLDNKIGVELEYHVPGFRNGAIGTIYYCYKDNVYRLCLGCNPSKYIKHDLDIKFHI